MANIIKPKRSTVAGKVPTTSDLTNGEIAINSTDKKIYTNAGGTITQVGAGALTALSDTNISAPSNGQSLAYDSASGKWINSNAGAGTVTSVGITASTGITVSGSPITTSGNITVGVSTKLAAIENLSGAGFFTQNGSGAIAARTIQAGTGISVAHGNGSSQDPTITNTGVTSAVAGTGITVSGATGAVTVGLANTAVTPGSYTNANITVDAQGRITSASNGTASGGTVTSVSGTGTVAGITLSGTVTSSGSLTLGGTFALPNGQVTGKMIYDNFTATASQTTFTTSQTYTSGKIDVYANGVKMVNGEDVTVTSGTQVVFASGLAANMKVNLVYPI